MREGVVVVSGMSWGTPNEEFCDEGRRKRFYTWGLRDGDVKFEWLHTKLFHEVQKSSTNAFFLNGCEKFVSTFLSKCIDYRKNRKQFGSIN